ncbi:hypothetical protein GCM10022255_112820 [Dactylosporangium darangshiense]|uniref:Uncharacterized protein n=2 Tax=Dactylosporangium darangshiense TaxID=579108 RepID=A0ABP8DW53_9ACTN
MSTAVSLLSAASGDVTTVGGTATDIPSDAAKALRRRFMPRADHESWTWLTLGTDDVLTLLEESHASGSDGVAATAANAGHPAATGMAVERPEPFLAAAVECQRRRAARR